MRMYDLILKKRNGQIVRAKEFEEMIKGFVLGEIPDYQMAAFLMAIFFRGLSEEEISQLTKEMANSGEKIDLSQIKGIKVDKHSTGGVGDKTSLIVGPLVASLGIPVAKMSGRGLGHTGGTVDKLESIPGYRTNLSKQEFIDIVNEIGISIIGQTANIAPADKKMYALRDVTATVDHQALIASSIMSKKIASGADAILLDVKTGSGAFMKDINDAVQLAQMMVKIGHSHQKKTAALITNMDIPLGNAVGNALEIQEVIKTLQMEGPKDLEEICLHLAANMAYLAEYASLNDCFEAVKENLNNRKALHKFFDMVAKHGADVNYVKNPEKLAQSKYVIPVCSNQNGYIVNMNSEQVGIASMMLGAGRNKVTDPIDMSAGVLLLKKNGDLVTKDEQIAQLHCNTEKQAEAAKKILLDSIVFSRESPEPQKLIFARVDENEIIYY